MKKRYSISKEQCTCGISELYDNVAKIMGVSDLSKVVYDCRKLSITKKVLDCLYEFYRSENQSDESIFYLDFVAISIQICFWTIQEHTGCDGFVTKGV